MKGYFKKNQQINFKNVYFNKLFKKKIDPKFWGKKNHANVTAREPLVIYLQSHQRKQADKIKFILIGCPECARGSRVRTSVHVTFIELINHSDNMQSSKSFKLTKI